MKLINMMVSGITGIALLTGSIATAANGISDEDMACCKKALSMQSDADDIGFEGFRLADCDVVFNDGRHDYVVHTDGSSEKRSPVISTFAATAYENDGSFEVIVPTKASMGTLAVMMGGEWDEAHQVSTIWHEAFHCFQLTNFRGNIEGLTNGHTFSKEDFSEKLINDEYAKNEKAKQLFTEQLEILDKARREKDIDNIREDMLKYKQLDTERRELISGDAEILEDYYTIVEGTAFYVEMMMTEAQSEENFVKEYDGRLTVFAEGSSKYYSLGGAQCLLLDRLDSEWEAGYDFSVPMSELIYEKLGV